MYTYQEKQDTDLYQEYYPEEPQPESSPIESLMWIAWGVICFLGLIIIFVLKQKAAGVAFIAIPTGMAMMLSVNFAFYVFMITLPMFSGIGFGENFTLTKAVGYVLLFSFAFSIIIGKMRFKFSSFVWIVLAFFAFVVISLVINDPVEAFIINTFSYVQFAGFFCVIYWLLNHGGKKVLLTSVRAYLAGVMGLLLITFLTGGVTRSMEESSAGRFSAGLGEAVNANTLSVIIGTGLIIAVYLLVYDKNKLWKLLGMFSLFAFPLILILTGSRGTLAALFGTFVFPYVFTLKPRINFKILVVLIILLGVSFGLVFFVMSRMQLSNKLTRRLTDTQEMKDSIAFRMYLNKAAFRTALKMPFGTGRINWPARSGIDTYPHNDIFYNTGLYGFPAGILLITIWIILGSKIKKLSLSPEKFLARSLLLLYLIVGLKGMYSGGKVYWMMIAIIAAAIEIGRKEETIYEHYEENEGNN